MNTSTNEIEARVGQARLEEQLKHLEKTLSEGLKRIELTISNRDEKSAADEKRLIAVELQSIQNKERTDRLYWVIGLGWTALGAVAAILNHFHIL